MKNLIIGIFTLSSLSALACTYVQPTRDFIVDKVLDRYADSHSVYASHPEIVWQTNRCPGRAKVRWEISFAKGDKSCSGIAIAKFRDGDLRRVKFRRVRCSKY